VHQCSVQQLKQQANEQAQAAARRAAKQQGGIVNQHISVSASDSARIVTETGGVLEYM